MAASTFLENQVDGGTELLSALDFCVVILREESDGPAFTTAVQTLLKICRNVAENPGVEKYKNMRKENPKFKTSAWQFTGAQQLMHAVGWKETEDNIVFLGENVSNLGVAVSYLENILRSLHSEKENHSQSQGTLASHQPEGNQSVSEKDHLLEQARLKQKEEYRRQLEEKRRITEQIKADRREADTKEIKSSHAVKRKFGSNMKNFKDIGVDLNKGGG